MKRSRILLSAFAVVFSLSMALATNVSRATEAWFKLDPDTGVPMERLANKPDCIQAVGDPYCAGKFNISGDGQPVDDEPIEILRGTIDE